MAKRDEFQNISPIDHRYFDQAVVIYCSEEAFIRYKLRVEIALVRVLAKRGVCKKGVVREVEKACRLITAREVYKEDARIHHDTRALVNCIQKRVSDKAKPYVHMMATSFDIIDSANAMRYRDVMRHVLIPALTDLAKTLIRLADREAETVQVGRTHGQHAVPITFGFAIAGYVDRLGDSIVAIKELTEQLTGKFSGAVGAYNASSLLFKDPEQFEREVLNELELRPAAHSTQIVPPESLSRLFAEVMITCTTLANLGDDMRHLQRTEISEVGERFDVVQVGSSTMPQKRNPITFEHVKSIWKIMMPRMITVLMDGISEHQRDLTNSASARTYGEIIAYATTMAKRMNRAMQTLVVDLKNLEKNLAMQQGLVAAEPLYIILARLGHPDAHEKVRKLTLASTQTGKRFIEVIRDDSELESYFKRMTIAERKIIENPKYYVGIAAKKTKSIVAKWRKRL